MRIAREKYTIMSLRVWGITALFKSFLSFYTSLFERLLLWKSVLLFSCRIIDFLTEWVFFCKYLYLQSRILWRNGYGYWNTFIANLCCICFHVIKMAYSISIDKGIIHSIQGFLDYSRSFHCHTVTCILYFLVYVTKQRINI